MRCRMSLALVSPAFLRRGWHIRRTSPYQREQAYVIGACIVRWLHVTSRHGAERNTSVPIIAGGDLVGRHRESGRSIGVGASTWVSRHIKISCVLRWKADRAVCMEATRTKACAISRCFGVKGFLAPSRRMAIRFPRAGSRTKRLRIYPPRASLSFTHQVSAGCRRRGIFCAIRRRRAARCRPLHIFRAYITLVGCAHSARLSFLAVFSAAVARSRRCGYLILCCTAHLSLYAS